MKFKTLAMSAAIAATVAVGTTVSTNPANALELNFNGSNRLVDPNVGIGGNSILDFKFDLITPSNNNVAWNGPGGLGKATLVPSTNTVFGNLSDIVTLKDLTLKKVSVVGLGANAVTTWVLQSPVVNFITGLNGGSGSFSLDTFVLTRTGIDKLSADYSGTFANIGPVANGTLTSQGNFTSANGKSFSSTLAVPTPALLPGLLGFGVAALRKRKGEEQPEAEAVEAKA
jgi:hypothetical protein